MKSEDFWSNKWIKELPHPPVLHIFNQKAASPRPQTLFKLRGMERDAVLENELILYSVERGIAESFLYYLFQEPNKWSGASDSQFFVSSMLLFNWHPHMFSSDILTFHAIPCSCWWSWVAGGLGHTASASGKSTAIVIHNHWQLSLPWFCLILL